MLRLGRSDCGIPLDLRADIAFDLWLWDNIPLDLRLGNNVALHIGVRNDIAFNLCFRDCVFLDRRIIPRKDKVPAAAAGGKFRARRLVASYDGVVLVVPRDMRLFSGDESHSGWLHPRAHVSHMEISSTNGSSERGRNAAEEQEGKEDGHDGEHVWLVGMTRG
jgi:hypothetical protein